MSELGRRAGPPRPAHSWLDVKLFRLLDLQLDNEGTERQRLQFLWACYLSLLFLPLSLGPNGGSQYLPELL